jgi:ABC-type uncharacterized transport system substrate-binding protein
MNRRAFLSAVTGGLLAAPLAAEAQPAGKVPRLAYLSASSAASATWAVEAFRQGLRDLGYIEGTNILIEYRWADGRFERLPGLAAELARSKVDIIVAQNTVAALAAKNATSTIPIILVTVGDPVGGLMTYGSSDFHMYRRAAGFVHKIFKGAKPADLPVEQPTEWEFVINLKTAKALGLTIPPSLLQRADQVIE